MESAEAMCRHVQLNPWRNDRLRFVHSGRHDDSTEKLLQVEGDDYRDHGYSIESELVDQSTEIIWLSMRSKMKWT
jgi:hypothetical protein